MAIYKIKQYFICITTLCYTLFYFHPISAESLSDCYAAIEATDQYLVEGLINGDIVSSVEKLVAQATDQCEQGLIEKGMETLTKASQSINSTSQVQQHLSKWTSDFGNIELRQNGREVTGNYPNYDGSIKASLLDNGALEGYWIQPSSEMKCDRQVEGSHYWGTFTFNNITKKKFNGHYAYCDLKPGSGGAWNGSFASGTKITLTQITNNALTADIAAGTVFNEFRGSFKYGNPVRIEADVTCDGVNDFVFGWEETMNPDLGGYHIAVVHQEPNGIQLTSEILRISGIEGGTEKWPEICKVPDHFNPQFTKYDADKDISNHYKLPNSCKQMVALDDGACDKLYMMWNPVKQNAERFIFFQMN